MTLPRGIGLGLGPAGKRSSSLWIIVRDQTVAEKERRKAAYAAAELLLPKVASRSRWPDTVTDDFGFAIHPNMAREYRDARRTVLLTTLTPREKNRLLHRMALIRARSPCPCPSRYTSKHIEGDLERLNEFAQKRNEKIALTPDEDAEEAHLRARYDSFVYGPEQVARRRRDALVKKARTLHRQGRRLSRRERTEWQFLQLLYPEPPQFKDYFVEADRSPFAGEPSRPDGLYYSQTRETPPPLSPTA